MEYRAHIVWHRTSPDFTYESYNRAHEWQLVPAPVIAASSAPEFRGDADRLDPERALVGALSSCHMLTFLALAARMHRSLDDYDDMAVGTLEKNENGKRAITTVVLRPRVTWSEGVTVSKADLDTMHRIAHSECYIANSVKADVRVEPRD